MLPVASPADRGTHTGVCLKFDIAEGWHGPAPAVQARRRHLSYRNDITQRDRSTLRYSSWSAEELPFAGPADDWAWHNRR